MIVFCSAPYRAATEEGIRENVERASQFSAFAASHSNISPINLMPAILSGSYGSLEDETAMEEGIKKALEIAAMVAWHQGELWVLQRPDGTYSSGCLQEMEVFKNLDAPIRIFRYDQSKQFVIAEE